MAEWLLRAGAIPAHEQELYEYGIYCVLFTLAPLALVLVISGFLHMVAEGVLLILPFMLIRKFCGGFHFRSPGPCLVTSTALLTLFLLGVRAVLRTGGYGWFCAALLVSFVSIVKYSPIDSEGRGLTQAERKIFRRTAVTLAGATLAVCALLHALHHPQMAVPLGAGLILAAVLQIPCVFIHRAHRSAGPYDVPRPEGNGK